MVMGTDIAGSHCCFIQTNSICYTYRPKQNIISIHLQRVILYNKGSSLLPWEICWICYLAYDLLHTYVAWPTHTFASWVGDSEKCLSNALPPQVGEMDPLTSLKSAQQICESAQPSKCTSQQILPQIIQSIVAYICEISKLRCISTSPGLVGMMILTISITLSNPPFLIHTR